MKIKKFLLLLISLSGYTFISVQGDELKREERKAESFSGIAMAIPGNVYVKQGDAYEVIVEAPESYLEHVITEVDFNILKIKKDNYWMLHYKAKSINVHITVPEIKYLAVSGSGRISVEKDLKAEEIELNVSGSGSIKIESIIVNEIESKIAGSGHIWLNGNENIRKHDLAISGSGDLSAEGLITKKLIAKISGSGSAYVYVTDEIDAAISGSGSIYYEGDPKVNSKVSGSGKVRKTK
ncbi:head GIN domain-containing protein [Bacteroidota bacterium]